MSVRVLIADDSTTMRRIMRLSLRAAGVKDAVEAADGEEAWTLFQQQRFDLVLADWNMPGKTGLELLQAIRATDVETPVAMVSVEADGARIIEAINEGATEYFIKPLTPESRVKLENLVRSVDCRLQALAAIPPIDDAYATPFLNVTVSVFESMLNCALKRGKPFLKDSFEPLYDVTAVIQFTGETSGAFALSFSRQAALAAAIPMMGRHPVRIDDDVVDVIGELANTIVGNAQAQFSQAALTLSAPSIIIGKLRCIDFPADSRPTCVPFDCKWGPLAVEFGVSGTANDCASEAENRPHEAAAS